MTRREEGFSNAEVWLLMLKEGGRWSAAEIGQRVGMGQTEAGTNLRAMHEFGTVQKWERVNPGDRVRFGVTPGCKVPRGVTVQDILACNLHRQEAA